MKKFYFKTMEGADAPSERIEHYEKLKNTPQVY